MGLEPTTEDPRAINDRNPELGIEAAKKRLQDAGITDMSDENIFISAACEQKGIDFLLGKAPVMIRYKEEEKPAGAPAGGGDGAYKVKLGDKTFNVKLDGDSAVVNGKTYDFSVAKGKAKEASSTQADHVVKAQMPGAVVRVEVSEGDTVSEGDVLLVVEAMKMETEIKSQFNGTVAQVLVSQGDQVVAGGELVHISA